MVFDTTRPLSETARSERLFRGELIVFRDIAAVHALIAAADRMIRAAFAPYDPKRAHAALGPRDYTAVGEALIAAFQRDASIRTLFRAVLEAVGANPAATFWDRRRLRLQPPGRSHVSRRVLDLAPHRDSWGSNVLAQANWWAPVYPVTARRSMVVYPAYWDRPIANTSAAWDVDALRAARRGGDQSYPLLPVASQTVDTTSAWPVVIEPGDLLCFSAAHLHASIPNTTGLTRFNVEIRSVNIADIRAGRGAPNLDGAAPRRPLDWFRAMDGGQPLDAALAAG